MDGDHHRHRRAQRLAALDGVVEARGRAAQRRADQDWVGQDLHPALQPGGAGSHPQAELGHLGWGHPRISSRETWGRIWVIPPSSPRR